mgnify:CR=1 FL=1|tara:strand:- start:5886 stop:6281 length:396 start_codon:yes stop_codon:yes gene_type:complete
MDITADKMVKAYIKMRDHRSALKAQYEDEDASVKDQMAFIETELLELCKTVGTDGLKTQFGTVSRSVKTRYDATDWEAMHKFVLEQSAPDLLERRVAQRAMKEFIENNPELMPPGLNVTSQYAITITRSRK